MSNEEILDGVREVLVEALQVDDDEVTPEATIIGDLGAESIDFLDIQFQLEKKFSIKIQQEELAPDAVLQAEGAVADGKLTETGLEELKKKLPHLDLSGLSAGADVTKVGDAITVDALVRFIGTKVS